MPPRLIAIVGPTASGKSSLGMHLAERLNGEIVSADSVQIYRGLDIGSAKPTREEMVRVRHHLIDIVDPTERFSAGGFARRAEAAIEEIHGRGKVPIVVGGTGLYLRALVYGLSDVAPGDPMLRQEIERELAALGADAMHAKLRACDPVAAERIHPNDTVRVVRAIEVYRLTGISLTAHHIADDRRPRYDLAGIALTAPRTWLWDRIAQRCDAMIAAGLVDELRDLIEAGAPTDAPGFQTIGYAHVMRLWRGELGADTLVERMKTDTRRYAKRQLTWFRKEHGLRWFDAREVSTGLPAMVAALRGFVVGAPFRLGLSSEQDVVERWTGTGPAVSSFGERDEP